MKMKHHLSTYFILAFGLAVVAAMVASSGMGVSSWIDMQNAGPMHVGKGPNPENGPFICSSRSGAHDYCGANYAIPQLLLSIVFGFFYGPYRVLTWIHAAEFSISVLLITASLVLIERLPIQRHAKYFYPVFVIALMLAIAFVDFVLWR